MNMTVYCHNNCWQKHGATEGFDTDFTHRALFPPRDFTLRNLLKFLWFALVSVDFTTNASTNYAASNNMPNPSSSTAVDKYWQQLVDVFSTKFTNVAGRDDEDDGNEDGDDKIGHRRPSLYPMVILGITINCLAHLSVSRFHIPLSMTCGGIWSNETDSCAVYFRVRIIWMRLYKWLRWQENRQKLWRRKINYQCDNT